MKNLTIAMSSILLLFQTTGCAPLGFLAAEQLGGAAIGSAVGAGSGAIFGEVNTHYTTIGSTVIGSGIGLGTGLLAGSLVHQHNLEIEAARPAVRRPAFQNPEQMEIDALREEMADSTRYGRGETKPWTKRYLGENPHEPFQGPGLQYHVAPD